MTAYLCMQVLCGLYAKIQAVLQRMPKEAAYRTHTQQIVQQRLQIVQAVSVPWFNCWQLRYVSCHVGNEY